MTFRGSGIGPVSGDGCHLYVKALRSEPDEAREHVLEAWRLTAPQRLVREYDAAHPMG